ncbi:MAG: Crp/Fnr family transcriptional regulator [Sphingobium sp.]
MTANVDEPFSILVRKLERLSDLDTEDRLELRKLPYRITTASPGQHLVREGDRPTDCCVLLSGFACRYKVTSQGARQIVSFHMAGDLLDLQHLMLAQADHSVSAITDAKIAWIPIARLKGVVETHPALNEALWRDALIDASIFREWVLNVGRRDGKSRVAHMLCEFAARGEAAGLGTAEQFELPMSQDDIGDATGLTSVHVNRMLQALAADGVISRDKRHVRILNWEGMKRAADFDAAYLHAAA